MTKKEKQLVEEIIDAGFFGIQHLAMANYREREQDAMSNMQKAVDKYYEHTTK